jgi:hypothetical protein
MDQLFDLVIYFYWGLIILGFICFVFLAMFFKIFFPKKQCYVYPIDLPDKKDTPKEKSSVLREDYDPNEERDPNISPSDSNDDYPPYGDTHTPGYRNNYFHF